MASQKSSIQADEKSYESRSLPLAESLARRGDFHLHMQRLVEARTLLDQAIEEDANLALAHESLGTYYFRQHDLDNAAKELRRATELNSKTFLTYYYSAILNLQQARGMPEEWPKAEASLEKAIALNPNFAPAYAHLATLYSLRGDREGKALAAARHAAQLEPGTISYSLNLGYVLLNAGRNDEARALASQILAAAKTPAEMTIAKAFQENMEGRAGMRARLRVRADQEPDDSESAAAAGTEAKTENAGGNVTRVEKTSTVAPTAPAPAQKSPVPASSDSSKPTAPGSGTDARTYEMTGKITALDCSRVPEVSLTISFSSIAMKLHATDLMKVAVKDVVRSTKPPTAACPSWKGRSAKMTYQLTPGKDFDGELVSVQFF
jgi:tetratricopeptide (TPR) repeat protein